MLWTEGKTIKSLINNFSDHLKVVDNTHSTCAHLTLTKWLCFTSDTDDLDQGNNWGWLSNRSWIGCGKTLFTGELENWYGALSPTYDVQWSYKTLPQCQDSVNVCPPDNPVYLGTFTSENLDEGTNMELPLKMTGCNTHLIIPRLTSHTFHSRWFDGTVRINDHPLNLSCLCLPPKNPRSRVGTH